MNWYVVIKDPPNRRFIPLAGPFQTKAQADDAADKAFLRFSRDPRSDQYVFEERGVASTNTTVRSIYGAELTE